MGSPSLDIWVRKHFEVDSTDAEISTTIIPWGSLSCLYYKGGFLIMFILYRSQKTLF